MKIGMTRRLERIKELSDASVPFDFDVHAILYSEDAPSLEAALHAAFAEKRVNRVNLRKEFFEITLDEVEEAMRSQGLYSGSQQAGGGAGLSRDTLTPKRRY